MNPTGPVQPVAPVQQTSENSPVLRVHQRITGEVVQIAAGNVTLMVDGVPIVARLSAPEQAAELVAQRTAHFVVREIVDGQVVLQTLRPGAVQPESAAPGALIDASLAGRVLEEAGAPVTPGNLALARALLGQGLEVTPAALQELQAALEGLPNPRPEDAQLAAALKAAGLPVTAGSIELLRQNPDTAGALLRLLGQLRAAVQNESVPARAALYQHAVQVLQAAIPEWNVPPGQLTRQLHTAAAILGQPLETLLAAGADGSGAPSLMSLAGLYRAARSLPPELLKSLDAFLETLRGSQLFNTALRAPEQPSGWSQLDFVLRLPPGSAPQNAAEQFFPARLRVARRRADGGAKVDPDYTRLVIQVEVSAAAGVMQVDLSIARQRVQAEVTTPDDGLAGLAQEELPGLLDGMTRMGYTMQSARVQVGAPAPVGGLPPASAARLPESAVDLAV